jgi:hypothetical protein
MTKDEDQSKEVLSVPKKDKLEDRNDEERRRDEERDRDSARDDRGGAPPPPPSYQQGYYPPPKPPLFTPEGLPKIVAIGILLGIILLFVGSMLYVSAYYMDPSEEDDAEKRDDAVDFQRTLLASSVLMNAIGLLLAGIFVILPLMLIKNLKTNQRLMLIALIAAIIIGFAFIQARIPYP